MSLFYTILINFLITETQMKKKELICFRLMLIMLENLSIKFFYSTFDVHSQTLWLEKRADFFGYKRRGKTVQGVRNKLKFIFIFHLLFLLITTFLISPVQTSCEQCENIKRLTLANSQRWAKLNKNYKSINIALNLICLPFLKQFLCYIFLPFKLPIKFCE